MGQEKSDRRIVPKKDSNASGGKATTVSKQPKQLQLFETTAECPQGANACVDNSLLFSTRSEAPKVSTKKEIVLAAMVMEEIANDDNLRTAFNNVQRNQGAPGPNRQTIKDVENHLDELLPAIRQSLLDGSYRPGMIRRVWIPKPGGGSRGLGIPDVIDRWVQQATYQVMSPHFETTFHESSHGFRPGRSCHTAIAEAAGYLEEGYGIVVDLDLEKFFDQVNHQRLLARLSQRIADKRVLILIHQMLKAKAVMPDGVIVLTEEGVPQGGPLSPLLSNIVLDELDQELSRRGHKFVRYADDCNIYVRSQRAGERVMASISKFIVKRLRLKVNTAKSAVAPPAERHFLGFRLDVNPMTMEVSIHLSERSKRRIDEKIRLLTPRNWGGSIRSCITRINRYLRGWIGFFWICTKEELRVLSAFSAHIRRRLRAMILKDWKCKRTIVRRLIKLGINRRSAWRIIYKGRRRLWALSHCPAVDRGLNNAYFAKLSLISLPVEWEQKWDKHTAIAQLDS